MGVILTQTKGSSSAYDPLFPWLLSIKKALDEWYSGNRTGVDLDKLLLDCISAFKHSAQYRNDLRFLKIWFIYCRRMRYVLDILYFMSGVHISLKPKGNGMVYQIGISRKAEPLEKLKGAQSLFVKRMSERLNISSFGKIDGGELVEFGKKFINPWSAFTTEKLSKKIHPQIIKYDGYLLSKKVYSGKVALCSLKKSSRNKIIEIGGKKYQIKGCAGQGGFTQVFKVYIDSNPDDIVALRYKSLLSLGNSTCIVNLMNASQMNRHQRSSFGFAHKIHIYSDCGILISDYLSHGTLQVGL
ncbi:mitotic checkpoint serine/threonine-protein kinase BUB1-like [Durio zibethinus]|uniref:Mitotic checkpoint serine/threonine-protein kinase BUB1-like n=1 Tax=Durio zibethinus TaxID=66656 RepID=A0A6P6AH17_DURZI|nr:mitotic checkpoint serine/threonine-protein kinase BUB1-like [Durio zibethinus]